MGKLNRRKLCECNICGLYVKSGNRFINGHSHKGKHPTEETLQKMRKLKGPMTEERKQKMRGPRGPMSEENKQKCRIPHGPMLEEQKMKMRKPRGPMSEKDKQSKRGPRGPQSKEHKQHQKEAQNRPEVKEKRSQSAKKIWEDPEWRENQLLVMNKPETKAKQSKSSKERWTNPIFISNIKQIQSKLMTERWEDPIYRENQLFAIGKGLNIKPNKPETLLKNNFIYWWPKIIYSGDYSIIINGKNPDFICFEKKKIIEFNGLYWHRDDIPGEREKIFAEVGYDTLILVDEDLLDIDKLKMKVDAFMIRENSYCV